jgi:hypothetical protein
MAGGDGGGAGCYVNTVSPSGEPALLPGACSPPGFPAPPAAAAAAAGAGWMPQAAAAAGPGEEDGLWFY